MAPPETLSAQFSIPWKLVVSGPPVWAGDSNSGPMRNGVWDMGVLTHSLTQRVFAVAVDKNGALAIAHTKAARSDIAGGDNNPCPKSHHIVWPAKGLMSGSRAPIDPVTLFYYRQAPGLTKARIQRKNQILIQPKHVLLDRFGSPAPKYSRASLLAIDLDADGIDDFVVWTGTNTQNVAGDGSDEFKNRLLFANVKGTWHLLAIDEDDGPCGC